MGFSDTFFLLGVALTIALASTLLLRPAKGRFGRWRAFKDPNVTDAARVSRFLQRFGDFQWMTP